MLSSWMTIHESSCRKSGSGYGPAACGARVCGERAGDRRGADAHDEQARALEEVAARQRPFDCSSTSSICFGMFVKVVMPDLPGPLSPRAARLMAAWMR